MLQRHYSGRSRMAVVFSLLCCPFLSFLYRLGAMTRRRLQKMRKAVSRSGYASFLPLVPCVLSASMSQSDRTELSRLRHMVWFVSASQSDQFELSRVEFGMC